MICGRCDKPILAGEEYEKRDIPSPSGAGATLYFHKPLCKKTPFQATQARESSRPAPTPCAHTPAPPRTCRTRGSTTDATIAQRATSLSPPPTPDRGRKTQTSAGCRPRPYMRAIRHEVPAAFTSATGSFLAAHGLATDG